MSFFYGCNRANAFRRQRQLSEILEATLGKKLVLPKRQMRSVEDFLKAFPEAKEVFIDGTERPIQRPKDKEKRESQLFRKEEKAYQKKSCYHREEQTSGVLKQNSRRKRTRFYSSLKNKRRLNLFLRGCLKTNRLYPIGVP